MNDLRDRSVRRPDGHRIHVREQPGDGPAIVLMHGFPSDHHLYDRLLPHLPGRHVVLFDFLGWGGSDKPTDHDYTFANQLGDLDAVVTGLGLDPVVLVAHDSAGPAAINWAIDHLDQVTAIVALDIFYSAPSEAPPNPPEAIRLFADPAFERLIRHFTDAPDGFRWLYEFQVSAFIETPELRTRFIPLLYRQFGDTPSTLGPFRALSADLYATALANTERHPQLQALPVPVHFVYGENDIYLTPAYGRALAALFAHGQATTIAGAGHFVQLDAPEAVAEHVLHTPAA